MDIQDVIKKANEKSPQPSYFEVMDSSGVALTRKKPYSDEALRQTVQAQPEKQVLVQFKKWEGKNTRNYFSVVVNNEAKTESPSLTMGLSGVSSIHEFAYSQEKAKADKLERENERYRSDLEAKKEKVIELERKIDKMQSDFQIERMEEAGERSSGLNGILNKASENPELLLGFLQSLPETIKALGEMGKGQGQSQQISSGGGSAELQVQHTAQQIAQWFMQLPPQEQQSFMQLLQLMIKENRDNELSYLEIFHNLKDLFNDDESQTANG